MSGMSDSSDLQSLLARLPHRPPMRLIEHLDEVERGTRAVARRLVRPDDWFLEGHFPGEPIVPAIVHVELIAQAGGLAGAALSDFPRLRLAAIHEFKFASSAVPGDELVVTATVRGRMGGLVRIEGEVAVGTRSVARGSLTLASIA
jgi:3-hydroxyacyl-[acyl-carrier-protein] dehydratase